MRQLITDTIISWARHGISAGSGALILSGYLTASQGKELEGAAGMLIALILAVADKVVAQNRVAIATTPQA